MSHCTRWRLKTNEKWLMHHWQSKTMTFGFNSKAGFVVYKDGPLLLIYCCFLWCYATICQYWHHSVWLGWSRITQCGPNWFWPCRWWLTHCLVMVSWYWLGTRLDVGAEAHGQPDLAILGHQDRRVVAALMDVSVMLNHQHYLWRTNRQYQQQ